MLLPSQDSNCSRQLSELHYPAQQRIETDDGIWYHEKQLDGTTIWEQVAQLDSTWTTLQMSITGVWSFDRLSRWCSQYDRSLHKQAFRPRRNIQILPGDESAIGKTDDQENCSEITRLNATLHLQINTSTTDIFDAKNTSSDHDMKFSWIEICSPKVITDRNKALQNHSFKTEKDKMWHQNEN